MLLTKQCKKDIQKADKGDLKKGLKTRHLCFLAIGGAMGSDFFLGTGAVVGRIGPAAIPAFMLGGVMLYLVMICLGELAVAQPDSGSFMTYAYEYVSPGWACGVGWSYWASWMIYIPCECTAAGIIMHSFFPQVNEYVFTLLFGLLIVLFNVLNVKFFGEMEFWLTIIKLLSLALFSLFAILVVVGVINGPKPMYLTNVKFHQSGGTFMTGIMAVLSNMVMLMVNFQGAEIIGISAAETKEPEKAIPKAIKNVDLQIILFYLVPVIMLILIMPYSEASANECIFSAALNRYGFHYAGGIFSFIALTAAISCANSGMYANVRVLYSLAKKGMAPRGFLKLNKNSVPGNAVIFTIVCSSVFLFGSYFFKAETAFTSLLSISGFTGTICSVSICLSQLRFRKKLYESGESEKTLSYKTPGYPFTAYLGIVMQVLCLAFCVFSPQLRIAMYTGVPVLVAPILIYIIRQKIKNR